MIHAITDVAILTFFITCFILCFMKSSTFQHSYFNNFHDLSYYWPPICTCIDVVSCTYHLVQSPSLIERQISQLCAEKRCALLQNSIDIVIVIMDRFEQGNKQSAIQIMVSSSPSVTTHVHLAIPKVIPFSLLMHIFIHASSVALTEVPIQCT